MSGSDELGRCGKAEVAISEYTSKSFLQPDSGFVLYLMCRIPPISKPLCHDLPTLRRMSPVTAIHELNCS